MERIFFAKFVTFFSVSRSEISQNESFILENDLSQPATEMDTVSRICSSTFKLGNTSFPPKDTINFRNTSVKSTAARLFTFFNLEFIPQYDHDRPASVAQVTETQCAPTGTIYRRNRGSIPRSTGRFRVRISGAHALRLISRAGKEGSTVSAIICDR